MKVEGVSLPVPPREIRELKDSEETSSCVCHLFYYVFYAMDDTGLLNFDNATDIFVLNLTFLSRINLAIHEFMEAFNHHKVRPENHWSPY